MLDIELLRDKTLFAEKGLASRGVSPDKVQEILKLDLKKRQHLKEVEDLRSMRNKLAKSRDIAEGKKLKDKLAKKEEVLAEAEAKYRKLLLDLPNLPLPSVPVGDPSKGEVTKKTGEPRQYDFELKDHLDLGERLGLIDTSSGAKVSGARFSYLKNEAVFLELALISYALERLAPDNFTPVLPPALIRQEITEKLGYWQAGGNENYYLVSDYEGTDSKPMYLIGTGEHAVVPIHEGDIIPAAELPRRYVAFSPCFRREAGSYGKDTRGIIRVHQFEKLEMVSFVRPEDGEKELEKLINISWEMMKDLGLPIRQKILSTEDISYPAAKTVDIETWFPSQKTYRETHSISTTTDYQARRLNTRFIENGKTGFVHILNGTAFAMGRTLAAIIENYQLKDGSIEVPKALRHYVGFDKISPN
ncbi:MAG TPA: serine--tRNA ligase [Patescibacteria group bacterium]|nr:serine--tRNA ligase [Patescibacteria group bacterium]